MSTIYKEKRLLSIDEATLSVYLRFIDFLVAIKRLGTIIVLMTACNSEYERYSSACTQLPVFDMFFGTLLLISTVSLLPVPSAL